MGTHCKEECRDGADRLRHTKISSIMGYLNQQGNLTVSAPPNNSTGQSSWPMQRVLHLPPYSDNAAHLMTSSVCGVHPCSSDFDTNDVRAVPWACTTGSLKATLIALKLCTHHLLFGELVRYLGHLKQVLSPCCCCSLEPHTWKTRGDISHFRGE